MADHYMTFPQTCLAITEILEHEGNLKHTEKVLFYHFF